MFIAEYDDFHLMQTPCYNIIINLILPGSMSFDNHDSYSLYVSFSEILIIAANW